MMDQTEEDEMATVTLVIVTYNSSGALAGCAASLAAVEVVGGYELIIVDNASRDDSVAQVRALFPAARLLENTQNRGFAAAVNQGVAAGTGRIVATLNPDTEVTAGWLQALVERLDADAGIGVVGSVIRDADGQVTHTAGTVDAVTYRTGHADGAAGSLDDVAYVTGAGIALRRADWDALGGFDEGFFPAYFEDLDLCLRVRARGQRCVVVAAAQLVHRESSSTGKYSGAFYYYYHRNRLRMVRKQLSRAALYGSFVRAEAQALAATDVLDCLTALLPLRTGLPSVAWGLPSAAEQAHVLAYGAALGQIRPAQRMIPLQWDAATRQLLGLSDGQALAYSVLYGAIDGGHALPTEPQVAALSEPLYQLMYGTGRRADVRVRVVGTELIALIEGMLATRNSDVFWTTAAITQLRDMLRAAADQQPLVLEATIRLGLLADMQEVRG
jgi:GT2 family glycosyltransferase